MSKIYNLKSIIFIVVLISIASYLLFYSQTSHKSPRASKKITITTSFYPLADFARHLVGEQGSVTNLTPAGVEPHDFEPTPQDIIAIHNSQLFIYNGAGFESWVPKVLPDLTKTKSVNTSQGIDLHTTHDISDPHIWLDPVRASQQVDTILASLILVDQQQQQQYYQTNAATYKQQLADLDQEFARGLANCSTRTIITAHDAFEYLAQRYNLEIIPISGLSPDEEPSPQKLAQIAQTARNHDIKYIFFEELVDPRLSQTIATEVGAQTLVFNPLEGLTPEQEAQGLDYISIQEQNLHNIKQALNCQ